MKLVRVRSFVAFVCNALTLSFVTVCVIGFFVSFGEGNMKTSGFDAFRFYTVDSNVLAAVAGLIMIPYNLMGLGKGKFRVPKWAILVKFVAACAIMVTMLTVLFILGPAIGYEDLFVGNNFYMHLVCPLMCFGSFVLCESGTSKIKIGESLLGAIPVVLYGGVYFYNVIISQAWSDFYGFTNLGSWQVVSAVFVVCSIVLCMIIMLIFNALSRAFK